MFPQTLKWSSTPYQCSGDLTVGWFLVNNNPIELRYWQWERSIYRFTMMDGALSNNIKLDLTLTDLSPDFNNDVTQNSNNDVDYNGDGLNDLIFTGSGYVKIFDVTDGKTLFEMVGYFIKAFDFDGDGKIEIAIRQTTVDVWPNNTSVTLVYATNGSATAMSSNFESLPNIFQLKQNYPNPFNPSTTIEYEISQSSNVKINVYDVTGRLVKELVNGQKNIGKYSEIWNGRDNSGNKVASGNYFYQIISGNFVQAKKMILLK
jgi:hypothetical protein